MVVWCWKWTNVPASFFESDTKVTYEKYDKYFANQVGETIYAVTEEFDYYTYVPSSHRVASKSN